MDKHFHEKYLNNCNIAYEPIELPFNGNPNFGKRCSTPIYHNGQGVDNLHLNISIPALPEGTTWVPNAIFKIIKWIEYQIGGTTVKKLDWVGNYIDMLKNGYNMTTLTNLGLVKQLNSLIPHDLYIPLPYIMGKNFPLLLHKLSFHDVRIILEFDTLKNLVQSGEHVVSHNGNYIGNNQIYMTDANIMAKYLFINDNDKHFLDQVEEITYNVDTITTTMNQSYGTNSKFTLNSKNLYDVYAYTIDNADTNNIHDNIKNIKLQYNGFDSTSPLKPLHTLILTWLDSNTDCGLPIHYLPFHKMNTPHVTNKGLIDAVHMITTCESPSNICTITTHKEQFIIKNEIGFFVDGYDYYSDINWLNNIQPLPPIAPIPPVIPFQSPCDNNTNMDTCSIPMEICSDGNNDTFDQDDIDHDINNFDNDCAILDISI